MLISVRYELKMNRATIDWIRYLVENEKDQKEIHSLGFSGTDEISVTATDHLVYNHLTYKWCSNNFVSKSLLTIFQTLLVVKREVSTEHVGAQNKERYEDLHFDEIDNGFVSLLDMVDDEGERIYGDSNWEEMVVAADEVGQRPEEVTEIIESEAETQSHGQ